MGRGRPKGSKDKQPRARAPVLGVCEHAGSRVRGLCPRCYWRKYYADRGRALKFAARSGIELGPDFDFEGMVAAQNGKCAICGVIPTGDGNAGTLHLDHEHETLKLRLLLCSRCNAGLEMMNDDPSLLEAAAKYLREHAEASKKM